MRGASGSPCFWDFAGLDPGPLQEGSYEGGRPYISRIYLEFDLKLPPLLKAVCSSLLTEVMDPTSDGRIQPWILVCPPTIAAK